MSAPDRPTRDLLGELQASLEAARRPTREQVDAALAHLQDSSRPVTHRSADVLAAEVRALRAELDRAVAAHALCDSNARSLIDWCDGNFEPDELFNPPSAAAFTELMGALRAALAARTPQPAEPWPGAQRWCCTVGAQAYPGPCPGHGEQEPVAAPLPAVPGGPREHVAAEANGVLWMAMRYALGRATYAVQEVGSAIAQHAHRLAPWQRERMAQEIERELGYDSDGAAWGSDAATWRQAISDLRAPLPAVPDGEDLRGPFSTAAMRAYYARLDGEGGEDVPARLDAAADTLAAADLARGAAALRDAASVASIAGPDVRAAVAAALARPTEPQR